MQGPTGLGQRRPRLSDEETRRRMLDTALAMVNGSGLTVSLDHISFEDVIRDAGVSRSAVYRRWPYKDLFFSDLLKELARAAAPAEAVNEQTAKETLDAVLSAHRGGLASASGRHDLISELIRQGAAADFEAVYHSMEWRTYLALHATFLSLSGGELRDEVQAALARAEQGFVERIARSWERVATLLGYRLRPEAGGGFETIATLAAGTMRGLVTMALSNPEVETRRVAANPVGASAAAQWSLSGLAAASIAMTFLEPDPDVEWDERRLASLESLFDPGA
ncbi:TetR/AcrR family transcriptional regulator [Microbispora sp. NPDC049125]|uniref:TetR/AcrR family transcriptional regulator n=1 Tax=Microbispora sp. NPDC049125 TaxID=3154929 RepID=UPI0034669908